MNMFKKIGIVFLSGSIVLQTTSVFAAEKIELKRSVSIENKSGFDKKIEYSVFSPYQGVKSYFKTVGSIKLSKGSLSKKIGNRTYIQNSSSLPLHKKVLFSHQWNAVLLDSKQSITPSSFPVRTYPREYLPYLSAGPFVETNDKRVGKIAQSLKSKIKKSSHQRYDYLIAAYRYTVENIRYVNSLNATGEKYSHKGAAHAATYGVGVCEDYAGLFVALLRKEGIPARIVSGLAYEKSDLRSGKSIKVSPSDYHAWVEVYSTQGWIPIEVTFVSRENQNIRFGKDSLNVSKKLRLSGFSDKEVVKEMVARGKKYIPLTEGVNNMDSFYRWWSYQTKPYKKDYTPSITDTLYIKSLSQ